MTCCDNIHLTMLTDVHLPHSMSGLKKITEFTQLERHANLEVLAFIDGKDGVKKEIDAIAGKPKPTPESEGYDLFKGIQENATNGIINQNEFPVPVEGYLYFGTKNFQKILTMLCQVNPFFASALTANGSNFELIAQSPHPASEDDTWYLKLTRQLTDPNHHINVIFNNDMSIKSMTRFDQQSGNMISVPKNKLNYYASGVVYNLFYYASVVHATIHVLHFLCTIGMVQCTRHNKSMATWASPYDHNIAVKYLEVAALLFDSNIGNLDNKILTGKNGFGATVAIMPIAREMLCQWGSFKTSDDYMKKFLLKGIYSKAKDDATAEELLESGGILPEFRKQVALIKPFADELSDAMKASNEKAFNVTKSKLTKFMKSCGEGVSSIDSISSWVQIMSCTGITHGSTLSYTRVSAIPEVMRWRDILNEEWNEADLNVINGALGTIAGMTEERHVFTSSSPKWKTKNIEREVMSVLQKYNGKSTELKEYYYDQIKTRSDFAEYGWILTDWCQDGIDGKQLTITTYI